MMAIVRVAASGSELSVVENWTIGVEFGGVGWIGGFRGFLLCSR